TGAGTGASRPDAVVVQSPDGSPRFTTNPAAAETPPRRRSTSTMLVELQPDLRLPSPHDVIVEAGAVGSGTITSPPRRSEIRIAFCNRESFSRVIRPCLGDTGASAVASSATSA